MGKDSTAARMSLRIICSISASVSWSAVWALHPWNESGGRRVACRFIFLQNIFVPPRPWKNAQNVPQFFPILARIAMELKRRNAKVPFRGSGAKALSRPGYDGSTGRIRTRSHVRGRSFCFPVKRRAPVEKSRKKTYNKIFCAFRPLWPTSHIRRARCAGKSDPTIRTGI